MNATVWYDILQNFVDNHADELMPLPGEPATETVIRFLTPLLKPKKRASHIPAFRFAGTILYNRGLGPECRNLPEEVVAATPAEAQAKAEEEADKLLGVRKWQEVRIRPLGPTQA